MPRPWLWLAVSAWGFASAGSARAATVLDRGVAVEIRADGSVAERTRLAVRLDREGDLAAWSPYFIALDENRRLESVSAEVRKPDGQVVRVARRAQDTAEVAGGDVLHSSGKVRTITFPGAPVGSVLALDYEVVTRPYYPAGAVALGSREAVDRLRVEVKGGGAGWRFRLDGGQDGFQVTPTAGGVVVTAAARPRFEPPELASGDADVEPVLRYTWGGDTTWEGVGRWYQDLLRSLPRASEPVRQRARELTAGLPGARERIAALTAFVRRDVRYVAVEVGIGGYRPAAPADVLARRWGDCKDKGLLLVDLLQEVGIVAYPVLIRSDGQGRVEPDFPAPDRFNHVIVAVPLQGVQGLELDPEAPVAEGFLFLDATQPAGGLSWLQPGAQDQQALIVRPQGSLLVRTPSRPNLEVTALTVEADVTPEGDLAGSARLRLSGDLGAAFTERFRAARPEEIEDDLRRIYGGLLPGAQVQELRWGAAKEGLPVVELTARLRVPGQFQGMGPGGSFQLTGAAQTPQASLLADRKLAVVVAPSERHFTWKLRFPQPLCPATGQAAALANELGAFSQKVEVAGPLLTVERHTRLDRRWIEPAALPALRDLALAEQRTLKKRIRLQCPGEG
jgi:Domain of Unknown Function with PDB structure (DUF3857)